MLHVAQEQDGWLTPEAMEHVGELLDLTAGRGLRHGQLLRHALHHAGGPPPGLGVHQPGLPAQRRGRAARARRGQPWASPPGGTTDDGEFTLEEVECIAFCGDAPCLAVNWRFFGSVTPDAFDHLVDDLRTGRLADEVPPHGTLCRVRRSVGLTAGERHGRRQRRRSGAGRGLMLTDAAAHRHRPPRRPRLVDAQGLPRHGRLRGPAQGPHHDAGGDHRGGHDRQPARPGRRRVRGRARSGRCWPSPVPPTW